jgi:hypothetical protein
MYNLSKLKQQHEDIIEEQESYYAEESILSQHSKAVTAQINSAKSDLVKQPYPIQYVLSEHSIADEEHSGNVYLILDSVYKKANEISNYNFAANINLNFNIIKEKLKDSPTGNVKKLENMANMLKTWFEEEEDL